MCAACPAARGAPCSMQHAACVPACMWWTYKLALPPPPAASALHDPHVCVPGRLPAPALAVRSSHLHPPTPGPHSSTCTHPARPIRTPFLSCLLPTLPAATGEKEGYKIMAVPPGYKPIIDPARKLMATPTPYGGGATPGGSGFYAMPEVGAVGDGPGSTAARACVRVLQGPPCCAALACCCRAVGGGRAPAAPCMPGRRFAHLTCRHGHAGANTHATPGPWARRTTTC